VEPLVMVGLGQFETSVIAFDVAVCVALLGPE
jgi:hypothetical protein